MPIYSYNTQYFWQRNEHSVTGNPSNMQTYSGMAQLFFYRVSLSQSRPILISCQSPTLLIKSKLLFLFVASNLCEHTRIYLQSAVAALKVKITVEIFFLELEILLNFHWSGIPFKVKASWWTQSFPNLGHPADMLKRPQIIKHFMYSVTLSCS